MKIHKTIEEAFDKDILQAARELAKDYHIEIEKNDSLGFVGHCKEMPMVMADGEKKEWCKKNIREAIVGTIATLLEDGSKIPQPRSSS